MAAEEAATLTTFGISGFEGNRPLDGSIRSSPIEVDLLLNPSHLGMGLCQVRVQR